MRPTPEAPLRFPLKGATSTARQSRFRGVCWNAVSLRLPGAKARVSRRLRAIVSFPVCAPVNWGQIRIQDNDARGARGAERNSTLSPIEASPMSVLTKQRVNRTSDLYSLNKLFDIETHHV